MPSIRFHGKTGTVKAIQGRAYVLDVKDGDKIKTVIAKPEHMKKVMP